MQLYYLQYACIPAVESDDYKDTGGAFVSCWIKADSMHSAKDMAYRAIQENHWLVQEIRECHPISKTDYPAGDKSLEYLQQAEIDGEVYVYNSWPNEPQSEDEVH